MSFTDDLSGMISTDDTLDGVTYGDLLAALQNDLQLNIATDALPGSTGSAMIADGLTRATAAAGALAGYLYFTDARGNVYKIPYYKP